MSPFFGNFFQNSHVVFDVDEINEVKIEDDLDDDESGDEADASAPLILLHKWIPDHIALFDYCVINLRPEYFFVLDDLF